jgi:hypothetical protein
VYLLDTKSESNKVHYFIRDLVEEMRTEVGLMNLYLFEGNGKCVSRSRKIPDKFGLHPQLRNNIFSLFLKKLYTALNLFLYEAPCNNFSYVGSVVEKLEVEQTFYCISSVFPFQHIFNNTSDSFFHL